MSSNTIIRPASREEWLEVRKSGIGSSEVATIVGLNPWETPYQLWRRKVGLDAPKEENFAMRAGHYLEDAVSLFWHDETGREIIKRSATDWIIRDNERPYMQVSPDRTFWLEGMTHNNANKGILECKTTQYQIDPDELPTYWFTQVQYQLGVAGYNFGSIAWLSQGRNFGYKDLILVEDYYQWLVEEVERFWVVNVIGKQEPGAVSVGDVMLKYSRHTGGKIIETSEEVFKAYKALKDVRKEIEALEERRDELESKIKLAFGDAEALTFGGQSIATWKAPKESTKFDAKAYQADHPDLCKPYMRPSQGARRFLLK